jgi:acyl-CoA thioesterase FadM
VGARVATMNDEGMLMQYIVVNADSNRVAALGEAEIVALVSDCRAPFPEELKDRIREFQRERT